MTFILDRKRSCFQTVGTDTWKLFQNDTKNFNNSETHAATERIFNDISLTTIKESL